jgi:branched-chain amino acid transport system ATP-binding protein
MAKQKASKNIFRSSDELFKAETNTILENVGLEKYKDRLAGFLPYGDQRSLEIGIALGSNPVLLLLDEPTAGMSPAETIVTMELVKKLSEEMNLTILMIEHDIDFVFSISDTIRVMHQGKMIAAGIPSEVKSNSIVQNIYLGQAANVISIS